MNLPSIEHRLSPPSAPDRVHPTVSRALDQYPASLAWHEPAHRSSPRSAADGHHLTKSSPRRITRRRMRAASLIIVSLPSRAPIDDCQGSSDEIFAPKSCLFRRVPTTAWAINSTDTTRNTCQRTAHHCHRDWFRMRASESRPCGVQPRPRASEERRLSSTIATCLPVEGTGRLSGALRRRQFEGGCIGNHEDLSESATASSPRTPARRQRRPKEWLVKRSTR